jgi:hypothetical protein
MPVLKNCVFNTQRSPFSPITGVTGLPLPCLTDQDGSMRHITGQDYMVLPEGALKSVFCIAVDPPVDVQMQDVITNIRYNDKVTPWLTQGQNETWRVLYIHRTPPGPLEHRQCFIGRFTGGGIPSA